MCKATASRKAASKATSARTEPDEVRDPTGKKVTPKDGVVQSRTFIENVETLSRYLKGTRP